MRGAGPVTTFGHPARIAETNRHLVDDLLALVRERGRQARQHRLNFFGGQSNFLAPPLMRVGWVGRMPFAVDDDNRDLALALGERVPPGWKWAPSGAEAFTSLGLCTQILLGPPAAPRVSTRKR